MSCLDQAEDPPDGQRALRLLLVHLAPEVAEAAGQPEVGDLGVLVVVHQDVACRKITVDNLE